MNTSKLHKGLQINNKKHVELNMKLSSRKTETVFSKTHFNLFNLLQIKLISDIFYFVFLCH